MTLDDLRRLGAAATPGPWHIGHIDENLGHAEIEAKGKLVATVYPREAQAFIPAARAHWDALLAVAEAATDALDRHRYGYDAASDLATDRVAIALAALEAIR